MTKYIVLIIETKTGKVVVEIEAQHKRDALAIEAAANINLNHDEYHTDIEETEEE